MVLVGLLLLALIFVVVGVVLTNVGWLIASLVVSVLAAGLLLQSFLQTRRRRRGARPVASAPPDAPVTQPAAPEPATGKHPCCVFCTAAAPALAGPSNALEPHLRRSFQAPIPAPMTTLIAWRAVRAGLSQAPPSPI